MLLRGNRLKVKVDFIGTAILSFQNNSSICLEKYYFVPFMRRKLVSVSLFGKPGYSFKLHLDFIKLFCDSHVVTNAIFK